MRQGFFGIAGKWRQTQQDSEFGGWDAMKKALWWVGGLCAAAAGFLVLGARQVQPVEALERRREEAWMDETDESITAADPAHRDSEAHTDDHAQTPAHSLV
jgi:hypothetical protein